MQTRTLSKLQVKQALRYLPSIITARHLVDYFNLEEPDAHRIRFHLRHLSREGLIEKHKPHFQGDWEWRNLLAQNNAK
jgi:uncharacterized protein YcaQ